MSRITRKSVGTSVGGPPPALTVSDTVTVDLTYVAGNLSADVTSVIARRDQANLFDGGLQTFSGLAANPYPDLIAGQSTDTTAGWGAGLTNSVRPSSDDSVFGTPDFGAGLLTYINDLYLNAPEPGGSVTLISGLVPNPGATERWFDWNFGTFHIHHRRARLSLYDGISLSSSADADATVNQGWTPTPAAGFQGSGGVLVYGEVIDSGDATRDTVETGYARTYADDNGSGATRLRVKWDDQTRNTIITQGIGIDAQLLNGQAASFYLARANHTGTQLAATISDFTTAARAAISVTDTATIDLTYSSGAISADVIAGSISNTHISSSAAIAFSKLAALTSANILVGNGSNVATSVAMSGDVTISNAGVTAIGAGKVTNTMLAGSIAYSKLILTNSIVNADVAAAAAIAYSKLNLAGSIVDADIAASGITTRSKLPAAIAYEDEANTFTGGLQSITPGSGVKALQITPTGAVSASISTGGALNVNNSGSTGAGAVFYSNQGATAAGRLVVINQDNTANTQQALRVANAGTGQTISVQSTNTAADETLSINSATTSGFSAVGITGAVDDRGTLKVTHDHYSGATANSDANAAILRLNWSDTAGNGTAVQGIFMATEAGGPSTTGDLVKIWNGPSSGGTSTTKLWLDANGQLALNQTGTTGGVKLGADVLLYRSAADKLSLGAGDSFDSPTILTPTIASFVNATHNHQNAAGGGTLARAAITDFLPITASDFGTQTANRVLAGPTSGGAATPTFRALVNADVTELLAIADLSDVTAKSGTGTTVLFQGSPTITTPTIADHTNATHNHQNAAGGGTLDHGLALTGLGDDDHTQYALLAGRSGGQVLIGGTAAGDGLTLQPTSGASPTGAITFDLSGGSSETISVTLKDAGTALQTAINVPLTASIGTSGGARALVVSGTVTLASGVSANAVLVFNHNTTLSYDNLGTSTNMSSKSTTVYRDTPTYTTVGAGAGTIKSQVHNTVWSKPTFGTTLSGSTGSAAGNAGVAAVVFQPAMNSANWTIPEAFAVFAMKPTGSAAGTFTKWGGLYVDDPAGITPVITTPYSVLSLGTTVVMAHAGSARFGATGTPTAGTTVDCQGRLDVTTFAVTGGLRVSIVAKSANYTMTANDFSIAATGGAGGITITLPSAANTGQICHVKKVDAGAGAVTVSGGVGWTLSTQNEGVLVIADGSTWLRIAQV